MIHSTTIRRPSVIAFGATALAIAGSVLGASPANAAQVWIQAIERPSAGAPCPASTGPDSENGWIVSAWTPSWERWANGGAGGWTCTRSIAWAFNSPAPELPPVPDGDTGAEDPEDPADPPASTCLVYIDGTYWIDIAPGSLIPLPASVLYLNDGCTGSAIQLNGTGYVVSTSSDAAAAGLCGGGYTIADVPGNADPSLFFCIG